jgi:hypothetical protein
VDQPERSEDEEQAEPLKFTQRHFRECQQPLHRKSVDPEQDQRGGADEDKIEDF